MADRERPAEGASDRREFVAAASKWFMLGGLAASYGACGAMGARYLFPARPRRKQWLFVARVADLAPGGVVDYHAPTGERIAVTRQGEGREAEDFVALSSVCPHLGCQVHWEPHNSRFFCPCHNGVFAPDGRAVSGPPAEADQALPRYALKVEGGLLYIEVPVDTLAREEGRGA